MRFAGLAAIAALALMACGNGGGSGDAAQGGAGETAETAQAAVFPSLVAANYRAEGRATDPDTSATTTMVQYRAGPKTRMEFTSQGQSAVMIVDAGAQEAFMLMPAQRMAMRVPLDRGMTTADQIWSSESEGATVTHTGACTVAGEQGLEWTSVKEGEPPNTGCVTPDGIMLRLTQGDQVVWETISITRGPQDAGLFVVPAGYSLTDLSNMGSMRP